MEDAPAMIPELEPIMNDTPVLTDRERLERVEDLLANAKVVMKAVQDMVDTCTEELERLRCRCN